MIPPAPSLPPHAAEDLARLLALDPRLERILAAAGPMPWRTRTPGFSGLLQAIVAQQISNAAASAIWQRLAATPGATQPAGLLLLSDEALKAAGLSRPKILHARTLAAAFAEGRLDEAALAAMPDEEAIASMVAVRGLGVWSAEIYLLFALQRRDVFPAGDLALAAAAAHLFDLPARPSPRALRELAAVWQPCRSLAARLLWHHWRFVTGRPAMDDLAVEPPHDN